jgi:hypothetical protein
VHSRAWTATGLASSGSAYTARLSGLRFFSRYHEGETKMHLHVIRAVGSGGWGTHLQRI